MDENSHEVSAMFMTLLQLLAQRGACIDMHDAAADLVQMFLHDEGV